MNLVSLPANPMAAIESQLAAKKTITQIIAFFEQRQHVVGIGRPDSLLPGTAPLAQWQVDKTFIDRATPFFWARDPIVACVESSQKIPGDTILNRWNLCHHAVWWHLDRPLPWQTITDAEAPIVAFSMGWGRDPHDRADRFVINAWCPFEGGTDPQQPLSPSQVFNWIEGESLDAMLQRCRAEHQAQYGPGGEYEEATVIGETIFMATAEKIARFVLAAFAWLNQKVVVVDDGHIERHRRKEYERVMNRKQPTVKVIQLRKREDAPKDDETDDGIDGTREVKKIDYACRWVVTGHWRNQACGKQFAERRLVFIHPYVKGPDDKPVKESVPTLYKVSR
jgi:hypothetical protein